MVTGISTMIKVRLKISLQSNWSCLCCKCRWCVYTVYARCKWCDADYQIAYCRIPYFWYQYLDGNTKPTTQDQALSIKYWVHSNASADWAGPRGKIAAKSILYSAKAGDADICFNLDPSNVDATEMSFALINSQDGVAPLELVSPADYKELITRRSATYNNGILLQE